MVGKWAGCNYDYDLTWGFGVIAKEKAFARNEMQKLLTVSKGLNNEMFGEEQGEVMCRQYIQVVTTTDKREDAEAIVKAIVEKRLAGCVQVFGPIVSTYWWKDNIETAEEWLCFIKSNEDLYEELEKCIKNVHPYETPEIVAIPIVAGSHDYLEWLSNVLKKK